MEEKIRQYLLELNRRYGFFNEEEIENTPKRIERFWEEWAQNREYEFTVFDNEESYDQMVILKVPNFYSMCSHHLLPFFGSVAVGYIPKGKICGISKLARLVRKYASRPQIQENMTQQILNGLREKLDTDDVMVVIKARHLCMELRGVKTENPTMVTSAISGVFRNLEPRQEFMKLIE
ncbi:MAG TPA: GTP cyclohydrolase I [Candidatus Methanofastidiosa archaeon]|nr:GTP cyclohydrolase I [Candidatus Methanofastidiosa archaeon]HPR41913.1 GTP cyclohydrolase I [Candidatus Methanofastidiosa archaeon]